VTSMRDNPSGFFYCNRSSDFTQPWPPQCRLSNKIVLARRQSPPITWAFSARASCGPFPRISSHFVSLHVMHLIAGVCGEMSETNPQVAAGIARSVAQKAPLSVGEVAIVGGEQLQMFAEQGITATGRWPTANGHLGIWWESSRPGVARRSFAFARPQLAQPHDSPIAAHSIAQKLHGRPLGHLETATIQ
jgi:hypothetical protein